MECQLNHHKERSPPVALNRKLLTRIPPRAAADGEAGGQQSKPATADAASHPTPSHPTAGHPTARQTGRG